MPLSCKRCNKNFCNGSFNATSGGLLVYDRLCPVCVREVPYCVIPKTVKVKVENLVETIQLDFIPHLFSPFHLNICHCGLPSWQQPCHWCGFYPMGANLCTEKSRHWMGVGEWLEFHKSRDFFLHYLSCHFGCCANMDHYCDRVLPKAATYEFPSAEEIWEAFGTDVSKEARDKLHAWNQGDISICKHRIIEDRSHAREYKRQLQYMSYNDRGYSYILQEAKRYPQEAHELEKLLTKLAGLEEAQEILDAIAAHELTLV